MTKKIVIALGGNALGRNLPEQMAAAAHTAKAIADLIEDGHTVVVTHGNGPQVGMINTAMTALCRSDPSYTSTPISVCTAMSQGYIGYDLQNALREELLDRGVQKPVTTILTQVKVNPDDPAFRNPSKPIGAFLSEEDAEKLRREGCSVMEDAGRGWRMCVASPAPACIVELDAICALMEAGHVVIACGGGGIPVCLSEHNHLEGVGAVVDKDFASELLAEELDADILVILTAVEKVAVNYGKPNQRDLDALSSSEARQHIADGQFAPGSMLPKVQAAVKFAESKPGRSALITLLEKARSGIRGTTGTCIRSVETLAQSRAQRTENPL